MAFSNPGISYVIPPQPIYDEIQDCFTWRHLHLIPVTFIFIMITGIFVSYVVALNNDHITCYMPFLSEMGAHVPEMNIFSMMCILGSFLGMVMTFHRYVILKKLLYGEHYTLHRLIKIACVIGLISWFALTCVGVFPMSTVYWAHLLSAILHFVFMMTYVLFISYIDYYVKSILHALKIIRISLCAAMFFFLFLLVIFFPLAQLKWRKINSHPPAMKKPSDPVFGYVVASASFEWILYAILIIFFASYDFEFRQFYFVGNVSKLQAKELEEENNPPYPPLPARRRVARGEATTSV